MDYKVEFLKHDLELGDTLVEFDKNIFTQIKPFEEQFGKDVSRWTSQQRIEFYKSLNTQSIHRLRNINSRLNAYYRFLKEINVDVGELGDPDFPVKVYEECLGELDKERYITREKLNEVIENGIINICDKFIFLGLFEGLKGKNFEDFIFASVNDINDNVFHSHSGRTIQISNELKEYAIKSAKTYDYYSVSDKDDRIYSMTGEDHYIIKNMYNAHYPLQHPNGGRAIYRKINRQLKLLGYEEVWSANSIYDSGMINWVHNKATELRIKAEELVLRLHAPNQEFNLIYPPITDSSIFLSKYYAVYPK